MQWRRVALQTAGVAAILGVGLLFVVPWAGAAVCPSCYGFQPAGPSTYVSGQAGSHELQKIRNARGEARRRVIAAFGEPQSRPTVLICDSEACYGRYSWTAPGSKALTFAGLIQVFSPRGSNAVIMAHEWTHSELHRRVGLLAAMQIPAWFNEGLAAYVSDDPRYIKPDGDRCMADPALALPTSNAAWTATAARRNEIYAVAACRIARWLGPANRAAKLSRFIAAMKSGRSFAQAYDGPGQ